MLENHILIRNVLVNGKSFLVSVFKLVKAAFNMLYDWINEKKGERI